jgi:hypothetical protein
MVVRSRTQKSGSLAVNLAVIDSQPSRLEPGAASCTSSVNKSDEANLKLLLDLHRPTTERAAAARALGKTTPDQGASWQADEVQLGLGQRIRDRGDSREVRIACIDGLAARVEGAFIIDLRALSLMAGDDPDVRRAALKTHADVVPHERHHELIASLLEGARTSNPYSLRSAVGGWGGRPEVWAVIDDFKGGADAVRRGEAAYCAAWVGETSIALKLLATDPDPLVRSMGVLSLEVFGWKTDEEESALRAALKDPDADVNEAARRALRKLGFETVAEAGRAVMPDHIKGNARLEGWWNLLAGMSERLLADSDLRAELEDDVVRSGWLGFPGASEDAIASAEKRIGRALPESYRDFLRVSNGWRRGPSLPPRWFGTGDFDWFRIKEPESLRIWTEDSYEVPDEKYFDYGPKQDPATMRSEYLIECLQLAEPFDGYVYLLNPAVVTPDGEWEAWLFGPKLPGATRYRSWRELVWQEWRDLEKGRPS